MEPMLMILPPPCRFITGWQARLARKALVRLVSRTWCHSLRARLSTGLRMFMPALLTSTSRRPNRSRVAFTSASTEASSSTFTSMASACAPRARSSATATRPFRSNAPTRRFPLCDVPGKLRVRESVTARRNLRLLVLVGVAHGEPGRGVALDAVGRHGIAQAVLGEGGEAVDHLGQVARGHCHEHLVVGDPAVAPLRVAGNGQRRLTRLERLPQESAHADSPTEVKAIFLYPDHCSPLIMKIIWPGVP